MKRVTVVVVALVLSGCMPTLMIPAETINTDGMIKATPKEFPYPGVYSGNAEYGIYTLKVNADGRGRSCYRATLGGKVTVGDVKYDVKYLHTEEGTLKVPSLSEKEMQIEMSGYVSTHKYTLYKTVEVPTVCRDFFNKE